jgi:hypothetical protein
MLVGQTAAAGRNFPGHTDSKRSGQGAIHSNTGYNQAKAGPHSLLLACPDTGSAGLH